MKNKALYIIISTFIVLALAACGPTPAPTMNPADAQGTAIAAAWTVVAMTQAAIPTATPIPPTIAPPPTALPTFTPLPSPTTSTNSILVAPTQPVYFAPTNPPVAGGPTADACQKPISANAAGHKVNTRIINQTDGSVVVSFYLQKTIFGECGYYSFNIAPKDSISAELLAGNYFVGAFITGKKADVKSFGTSVDIKGPSTSIRITNDFIKQ